MKRSTVTAQMPIHSRFFNNTGTACFFLFYELTTLMKRSTITAQISTHSKMPRCFNDMQNWIQSKDNITPPCLLTLEMRE
mmetsp:Transcript_22906/g.28781  ORF Transcript_22906/g.28781 Transcript_22906/m.28781 type:complete len:80 (-) Transcript_22906:1192-1431(-)